MDIGSLVSTFGGITWAVLAFILALSVIVAIHEYGHYIVGRWSGIDADVFSIGFGPVLFARTDKRGTQWQIAALPLGGYVKFRGDANAASVGGDGTTPKARNTMLGAPLWARTATVLAGPVFNFLFSILLFTCVLMLRDQAAEPLTVDAVTPLPFEVPLEQGDVITSIGGTPVTDLASFDAAISALPVTPTVEATVEREGEARALTLPYPLPSLAVEVQPRSAAFDVGLERGDLITEVDGEPVFAFSQLQDAVAQADSRAVLLTVWRAGEIMEFAVTPRRVDIPTADGFVTRNLVGISGGGYFEPMRSDISFGDALVGAVDRTWFVITSSLSGLYNMIIGAISTCNISGPLGIAETSGQVATLGILAFVSFIAVLSTAVGLMNLFPVPMLDGGHLIFYAYEAVTGRPPSEKALQVLMAGGLALIGTLMVFALTNDIFCP